MSRRPTYGSGGSVTTRDGQPASASDADLSPDLVRAPARMRGLVARRPLTAFFALAIALPWICAPLADRIYYSGLPPLLGIALALPFEIMVVSPLVAALLVTATIGGRRGVVHLLGGFLQWRVGWRWYAVALALPPALAIVPAYLNVLWGAPAPSTALAGSGWALLGAFALRLVNPWDGPVSEELGWRGFALPRLQRRRQALQANLVLAFFVITWHLRLVANGDLPLFALVGTLAATILFGWLFNNTGGSLLLVYLFHAADGVVQPQYVGGDSTRYLWLKVTVWVIAAVGVILYSGRNLVRQRTSPKE
jgi:membrane protease YdiL (CAAX protease family)